MARKRMLAAATAVILGAGGLAYAADESNPLLQLVKAVQVIDGNTLAIADQTSAIAKQTTTVVEQNAALAKASTQLDQKLDAVLHAIGKIEVPPPAPPAASASPAHAVWLAPYVRDGATLNGQTYGRADVLNAGALPATLTCSYFSDEGARLSAHDSTLTIAPGQKGSCWPKASTLNFGWGWLLIVSDNPVIATGTNSRVDHGTFTISENMPFRPIDCSGDWTGIGFVCDAVESIQQGK